MSGPYQLSSASLRVRMAWLNHLGGLPRPTVKNSEWLSLLEDESRNSLMIEGYFVTKRELQQAIRHRKSAPEVVSYFDAARQSYDLAYAQFQENDFSLTKWIVREMHSAAFRDVPDFQYDRGTWRKGEIMISGARCQPPKNAAGIDLLLDRILFVINKNKRMEPWRKAAVVHAMFELLHPFPDGNGRVGRLLANFVLVAHGLPNIVIKGDEAGKSEYLACLDEADTTTNKLLAGQLPWTKVPMHDYQPLELLFRRELAESLDRMITASWRERGNTLMPLTEIAQLTGRALNSLKVQCATKQFISIKLNNRLMTHPDLLSEPGNGGPSGT